MKSDPEERFKVDIDCVQLRQVGKTIKRRVHSSFFLFDKLDNRVDPLLIENAVRSENHQANIGMKPEVRRNLHFSCRETTRFCKVSFELFRRYAKPSAVHRTLVRYRHWPRQALCDSREPVYRGGRLRPHRRQLANRAAERLDLVIRRTRQSAALRILAAAVDDGAAFDG